MRILMLSVAAIAMTGCSLQGYHADTGHHSTTTQSGVYTGGHHTTRTVSAPSYTTSTSSPYYTTSRTTTASTPIVYNKSTPVSRHAAYNSGTYHSGTAGYSGQTHHASSHGTFGSAPPALRGGNAAKGDYFYGNLGAVLYDVGSNGSGVIARAGYQSQHYIGAEVEGTIGVISGDLNGFDSRVKGVGAGYAIGRVPLSDRFSAHARGGYFVGDITRGGSVDGFAYGGGVEYALDPRSGIRADYTRYDESDFGGINSVSVAYTRRF